MEKNKNTKKEYRGEVVSNKMQDTVKVAVSTAVQHPKYKKVMKRTKMYMAHTKEELQVGNTVTIRESKPYSKRVKWVVVQKHDTEGE